MNKIFICALFLGQCSFVFAAGNPVATGDVVGRDLGSAGMGVLGHVGLFVSANKVTHVTGTGTTPYKNVVQNVTLPAFKVEEKEYWGARAKQSFTWKAPHSSAMNQINTITEQQRPYIAYSITDFNPNPAKQVCSSKNSAGACTAYTWVKGTFRCDTFVKWLYTETNNGSLGGTIPRGTYNSSLLTITRS